MKRKQFRTYFGWLILRHNGRWEAWPPATPVHHSGPQELSALKLQRIKELIRAHREHYGW